MNSVFVIEQLQQNGKPEKTAKYYLGLTSHIQIETTYSLGKAIAIEGANWNFEAAVTDLEYLEKHTTLPMRIREVKLSVQRYDPIKWRRPEGGG